MKQILNLGKVLTKAEQKQINGGSADFVACYTPNPGGCAINWYYHEFTGLCCTYP